MNGRSSSWWIWLLMGIVLLGFVSSGTRVPVLPLIIVAIILSKAFHRRSAVSSRPHPQRPLGHGDPRGQGDRPGGQGTWTAPPQDSPMPTIDVPRYPGDGPVPGPPPSPYRDVAGPPPQPAHGDTDASPTPGPGTAPAPGAAEGAPHTSTDPAVSLGQLHLGRCGRDLQAAASRGTAAEVTRVLDEVRDLSRRMQDMLGAADGTPGSGRREFLSGLRALDRLVEDAREERSPGARLTRVIQACLRMGQTGRHE